MSSDRVEEGVAPGSNAARSRGAFGAAAVVVGILLLAGLVRVYSSAVEDQYPLAGVDRLVVEINQAPAPTIQILPGIGPVLAERIVAERARAGAFVDLSDLERRVSGVGPGICQRLGGLVGFGTPTQVKESLADGAEPGSVR